jgi:hypothetical protein
VSPELTALVVATVPSTSVTPLCPDLLVKTSAVISAVDAYYDADNRNNAPSVLSPIARKLQITVTLLDEGRQRQGRQADDLKNAAMGCKPCLGVAMAALGDQALITALSGGDPCGLLDTNENLKKIVKCTKENADANPTTCGVVAAFPNQCEGGGANTTTTPASTTIAADATTTTVPATATTSTTTTITTTSTTTTTTFTTTTTTIYDPNRVSYTVLLRSSGSIDAPIQQTELTIPDGAPPVLTFELESEPQLFAAESVDVAVFRVTRGCQVWPAGPASPFTTTVHPVLEVTPQLTESVNSVAPRILKVTEVSLGAFEITWLDPASSFGAVQSIGGGTDDSASSQEPSGLHDFEVVVSWSATEDGERRRATHTATTKHSRAISVANSDAAVKPGHLDEDCVSGGSSARFEGGLLSPFSHVISIPDLRGNSAVTEASVTILSIIGSDGARSHSSHSSTLFVNPTLFAGESADVSVVNLAAKLALRIEWVRCLFSDRNLHSRMPLDPTHVRFKRIYV